MQKAKKEVQVDDLRYRAVFQSINLRDEFKICYENQPLLELSTMPVTPIEDFKTIKEAAEDRRVPYTTYWIRRLVVEKRVQAIRIGPEGRRGQWLVNIPDLLRYIEERQ